LFFLFFFLLVPAANDKPLPKRPAIPYLRFHNPAKICHNTTVKDQRYCVSAVVFSTNHNHTYASA